jgi:hypothetical protein
MIPTTLNPSRHQQEVVRRIYRLHGVAEDGVKIRAPRPQLHEPDKPHYKWTVQLWKCHRIRARNPEGATGRAC